MNILKLIRIALTLCLVLSFQQTHFAQITHISGHLKSGDPNGFTYSNTTSSYTKVTQNVVWLSYEEGGRLFPFEQIKNYDKNPNSNPGSRFDRVFREIWPSSISHLDMNLETAHSSVTNEVFILGSDVLPHSGVTRKGMKFNKTCTAIRQSEEKINMRIDNGGSASAYYDFPFMKSNCKMNLRGGIELYIYLLPWVKSSDLNGSTKYYFSKTKRKMFLLSEYPIEVDLIIDVKTHQFAFESHDH